jgi:glycosyltransferase involved in cell wall biosynthesis
MTQLRLTMLHWTDPLRSAAGGIDTFVQGLIRFAPPDVCVDVVGVTGDPEARPPGRWLALRLGEKPFRLFPLFAVRDPWARSRCPLALRFTAALLVNRERFASDLFLTHAIEPVLALRNGGMIAAVMHANPHEVFAGSSSSRWRRFPRAYRAVEKVALANVSRLYVVRESARERYSRLGLDAPVILTPTGIDAATFTLTTSGERREARRRLRRALGLHDEAVIGVAVGRLELEKDFALLLAAIQLTHNEQLHLVLIGEGSERANLEKSIAADNLSKRVSLLGARTASEIAAVHCGADFYCMSSSYEGMSIALLEAQACGLPAIAADVGEARRTIEDGRTGVIVQPRTALSFARAMLRLVEQRRQFSPEACAAKVADFAQQTVAAALHVDLRDAMASSVRVHAHVGCTRHGYR